MPRHMIQNIVFLFFLCFQILFHTSDCLFHALIYVQNCISTFKAKTMGRNHAKDNEFKVSTLYMDFHIHIKTNQT